MGMMTDQASYLSIQLLLSTSTGSRMTSIGHHRQPYPCAFEVLDTIEAIEEKPVSEIVKGNCRFASEVRFSQDEWATADAIGKPARGRRRGAFHLTGAACRHKGPGRTGSDQTREWAPENHGCV